MEPTSPMSTHPTASQAPPSLLEVRNLVTRFYTDAGVVHAVDGVDFTVQRGEVFGLVGESGCGKSVTGLSIMRLVDAPGKILEGEIRFGGQSLLDLSEKEMEELRGSRLSMIFQQPLSCLNPVFTVGGQVAEVLEIHRKMKKQEAAEAAVDLLRQVGIPDPAQKAGAYPHEMSGGQAQRVMIAMALALNPELLIADEPTTALDVTIQAQILDLMREMIRTRNTGVILITHDLGVVAEMADRVAVMYAGRIVEQSDATILFDRPLHPYTQGLAASVPVLGQVKERLETIAGVVPDLVDLPPGCRFAPRCAAREKFGLSICTKREPDLIEVGPRHSVRCWLYQNAENHKAPLAR
jgi:oligopeptide/dipeptide ABC transporter ATP-binding protein